MTEHASPHRDWQAGFCTTRGCGMQALAFEKANREDRANWHSRSPLERLRHVVTLRELNRGPGVVSQRLQRVVTVSERAGVEYLLIGGHAVGYHGYRRAAGDLDVWIG